MPTARTPSVRLHGGWPGFSGVIISCVSTCDLPWIIGVKSFHVIFHSHFESFHQSPQNPQKKILKEVDASWCFPRYFRPTSRHKSLPCQVIWGRRDPLFSTIDLPKNAQLRRWKITHPNTSNGDSAVFTYMQTKKTSPVLLGFTLPNIHGVSDRPNRSFFAHFPIHIRYGFRNPAFSSWYGEYPIFSWRVFKDNRWLAGFLNYQQYIHSSISRLFSINSLGPILSMHRISFTWPKNPGIELIVTMVHLEEKNLEK